MYGLSYGEGFSHDDGNQGMWWVRRPDATGCSIEWFDTQKEARARYDELLTQIEGGES